MKLKCPHCGFEQEYKFLGYPWKGLRALCRNCEKWFEYHTEKGYIKINNKEV